MLQTSCAAWHPKLKTSTIGTQIKLTPGKEIFSSPKRKRPLSSEMHGVNRVLEHVEAC